MIHCTWGKIVVGFLRFWNNYSLNGLLQCASVCCAAEGGRISRSVGGGWELPSDVTCWCWSYKLRCWPNPTDRLFCQLSDRLVGRLFLVCALSVCWFLVGPWESIVFFFNSNCRFFKFLKFGKHFVIVYEVHNHFH